MKLYVKTQNELEAYGLASALNQYTQHGTYSGAIGVLFDNKTLECWFVKKTFGNKWYDNMVESYIGVANIQDILIETKTPHPVSS